MAEQNNITTTCPSYPSGEAAEAGKFDLITSCFDLTEDRLMVVDFSVPYRTDQFGLLSRKSLISKLFIFRLLKTSSSFTAF